MVDKWTMEKYEKEAKDAGRESWYLSWALDSTPQERDKGKTVEVGRGYFETELKTVYDSWRTGTQDVCPAYDPGRCAGGCCGAGHLSA